MGSGGIRRLATSVRERSSDGATRKRWQLNPGVYETGGKSKEIAPLGGGEWSQAPVVDDEQVGFGQAGEHAGVGAISTGHV